MVDFLYQYYLWVKAFHLIFVISWMAALLYLPRIYVYHALSEPGSSVSNQFLVMERKLIKMIMNPAMILTFLFGGILLFTPGMTDWSQGWIHVKLSLVLILAAYHGFTIRWYKGFVSEKREHSHVYFRLANEIPAVIMAIIVIMVIVRPF